MQQLQVTIKSVYGRDTIYPVCDQSKLLAALAKQTTFTNRELNLIKQMGYEIQVVAAVGTINSDCICVLARV